jgi:hypothetical protein
VPFTAHVNNIAKYVAATTLTMAEWNNTALVRVDLAAEQASSRRGPARTFR